MSGTLDVATDGLLDTSSGAAAAGGTTVVVQQSVVKAITQQSNSTVVVARSDMRACPVVQVNGVIEIGAEQPTVELPLDCRPPRTIEIITPGPQGPPGAPGGSIAPMSFAFGDAPHTLWTATSSGLLTYVRIKMLVAFNGVGAAIRIGTPLDAESVMPAAFSDPASLQEFENTPDVVLAAGDAVVIAVTPGVGATAGSGIVLLDFLPY